MTLVFDLRPHRASVAANIYRLLEVADREFTPPLSTRTDTLTLAPDEVSQGVDRYAVAMALEDWLVSVDADLIVGFLSFLERPAMDHAGPVTYVTTLVVAPTSRRQGVGSQLYQALETYAELRGSAAVETRTWSTNVSHLELLGRRGFVETRREFGSRGPGLDTVYLRKPLRAAGQSSSLG